MLVHVIGDTRAKLAAISRMLEQKYAVISELLDGASGQASTSADSLIVAVNLRVDENISALKAVSVKLARIPKRVFVIDQRTRLALAQAYALGATHVLTSPVSPAQLI